MVNYKKIFRAWWIYKVVFKIAWESKVHADNRCSLYTVNILNNLLFRINNTMQFTFITVSRRVRTPRKRLFYINYNREKKYIVDVPTLIYIYTHHFFYNQFWIIHTKPDGELRRVTKFYENRRSCTLWNMGVINMLGSYLMLREVRYGR